MKIKIEIEYKGEKLIKNYVGTIDGTKQILIMLPADFEEFVYGVDQILEQEKNEELEEYVPDWID